MDVPAYRVIVGYGKGALAVLDLRARKRIGDIALKGHPESFRLDHDTNRAFVNDPSNRSIAVIDLAMGKQTATWPVGYDSNLPMALDGNANTLSLRSKILQSSAYSQCRMGQRS